MSIERPMRQEVDAVVRDAIVEAEKLKLPKDRYTWHRRFEMGIDRSIDAAEKRSRDLSTLQLPKLHKTAELAWYWLRAQKEKSGSYERAHLLSEALGLFAELTA